MGDEPPADEDELVRRFEDVLESHEITGVA